MCICSSVGSRCILFPVLIDCTSVVPACMLASGLRLPNMATCHLVMPDTRLVRVCFAPFVVSPARARCVWIDLEALHLCHLAISSVNRHLCNRVCHCSTDRLSHLATKSVYASLHCSIVINQATPCEQYPPTCTCRVLVRVSSQFTAHSTSR